MLVETYEIEETLVGPDGTVTEEVDAEAIQLIKDLNLAGQEALVTRDDGGEERRIPYPLMSAHERAVYRARFPVHEKVAEYRHGMIPIRVLQVIAHARPLFAKIEVWHTKAPDPDPLLVGYGVAAEEVHLLARWGDALAPFTQLIEEARASLRERFIRGAKKAINRSELFLSNVDDEVDRKLAGEYVPEPY